LTLLEEVRWLAVSGGDIMWANIYWRLIGEALAIYAAIIFWRRERPVYKCTKCDEWVSGYHYHPFLLDETEEHRCRYCGHVWVDDIVARVSANEIRLRLMGDGNRGSGM
jgi:DNA-directed RNA polymerase subunit RPC12/RpoP